MHTPAHTVNEWHSVEGSNPRMLEVYVVYTLNHYATRVKYNCHSKKGANTIVVFLLDAIFTQHLT